MLQLAEAKALDEAELKDLTIAVNRRGDLLNHEVAADTAINELRAGIAVEPDRLSYALEVPPSHLSSAQRTALVQQLQAAIHEDDAREQAAMSYGGSDIFYENPEAPSVFGHQEQLAQKEIMELEAGNHVSWDEVNQAMQVPPERP
jgi:hypothetical protein